MEQWRSLHRGNRPLAKLKNYVLIAQKTRNRNQVSSDKSLII
jgi:hypothetical protein